MKKRQILIVLTAVLIVVGSIFLSKVLTDAKEAPEKKDPIVAKKYVKTTSVRYDDIQTDVLAYGRVKTAQSLDLLSEVAGRMFEGKIRLKEGVNFKKGTLLFYVDDREASLNLKSQKSNFLRDLAAILPDLKIDFGENYSTWQQYFSTIDIDKNLPALPKSTSDKEKTFLATKGIYSTYYTIKSAEERLRKYRYYAPWDGSISEMVFETGAFINPGIKIGRIMRSGLYELQVSVETKDVPWIQEGAPAKVFAEETQQLWEGQVSRISDFVNQSTQSVDVFVAIRPSNQRIYDGQFMQAAIPARIIKDGMIIPRNAIYNNNEVFVLEDTLLKTKKIDIYRLSEEVAIFGGLEACDELVVEPLINAHNNMTAYKLNENAIDLERKNVTKTKLVANPDSEDVVAN
ncbi:MAG: efflux RND transporter periplasmic adaptor subunit [Cyclobacteriaceae bacterium]|nr:efflux RND transporter periplasmic adaptor subunit [Cyclobacteriaceae bacterium HetDA_MAG_MS6]